MERAELEQKSDAELQQIAIANGLKVDGANREQLIEILLLAANNELPDEGKTGMR